MEDICAESLLIQVDEEITKCITSIDPDDARYILSNLDIPAQVRALTQIVQRYQNQNPMRVVMGKAISPPVGSEDWPTADLSPSPLVTTSRFFKSRRVSYFDER